MERQGAEDEGHERETKTFHVPEIVARHIPDGREADRCGIG